MDRKSKVTVFVIVILILALALVIAVIVSGRNSGGAGEPPAASGEEDSEQPAEGLVYEPVAPVTRLEYEGGDISKSSAVGVFENSFVAESSSGAGEVFGREGAGDPPTLTVREDGTFTLIINAFDAGMLTVEGTASIDGYVAEFVIEERPERDFLGADLEGFAMRIADENNLRYDGEYLGTMSKGDIFTRVSD